MEIKNRIKLLCVILFCFIQVISLGQSTEGIFYVPNATTAFGRILSKGTTVKDRNTSNEWSLTATTTSNSQTLTSTVNKVLTGGPSFTVALTDTFTVNYTDGVSPFAASGDIAKGDNIYIDTSKVFRQRGDTAYYNEGPVEIGDLDITNNVTFANSSSLEIDDFDLTGTITMSTLYLPENPEFYAGATDSAKIVAALAAVDLVKFSNTYSAINKITIPANKTLDFSNGGSLSQVDTIVLNSTKIINPDNHPLFKSGVVLSGTLNNSFVVADWFNNLYDIAENCDSVNIGVVKFTEKEYVCTPNDLVFQSDIVLDGVSGSKLNMGAKSLLVRHDIEIHNMELYNSSLSYAMVIHDNTNCDSAVRIIINNCKTKDVKQVFKSSGYYADHPIKELVISNSDFENCFQVVYMKGALVNNAKVSIIGNTFHDYSSGDYFSILQLGLSGTTATTYPNFNGVYDIKDNWAYNYEITDATTTLDSYFIEAYGNDMNIENNWLMNATMPINSNHGITGIYTQGRRTFVSNNHIINWNCEDREAISIKGEFLIDSIEAKERGIFRNTIYNDKYRCGYGIYGELTGRIEGNTIITKTTVDSIYFDINVKTAYGGAISGGDTSQALTSPEEITTVIKNNYIRTNRVPIQLNREGVAYLGEARKIRVFIEDNNIFIDSIRNRNQADRYCMWVDGSIFFHTLKINNNHFNLKDGVGGFNVHEYGVENLIFSNNVVFASADSADKFSITSNAIVKGISTNALNKNWDIYNNEIHLIDRMNAIEYGGNITSIKNNLFDVSGKADSLTTTYDRFITLSSQDTMVVDNNKFIYLSDYNSSNISTSQYVLTTGTTTGDSYFKFSNNIVDNKSAEAIQGGIITGIAKNIILDGNVFNDCDIPFYSDGAVTYAYINNNTIDSSTYCFQADEAISNLIINNNTYSNSSAAYELEDVTSMTITGDIMSSMTDGIYITGTEVIGSLNASNILFNGSGDLFKLVSTGSVITNLTLGAIDLTGSFETGGGSITNLYGINQNSNVSKNTLHGELTSDDLVINDNATINGLISAESISTDTLQVSTSGEKISSINFSPDSDSLDIVTKYDTLRVAYIPYTRTTNNKEINFDGTSSEYLAFNGGSVGQNWTVSAWVDGSVGSGTRYIFGGTTTVGVYFNATSLYFRNGTDAAQFISYSMPAGYHNIIVIKRGTVASFFVDNDSIGSLTYATNATNTFNRISRVASAYSTSAMSLLGIWSRALTPAERTTLYGGGEVILAGLPTDVPTNLTVAYDFISPTWSSKTSNVTISVASPCVVTWNTHGLTAGRPIILTTDGTLPTGLTPGTVYFVATDGLAENTFRLSTNFLGVANVTTTGAGSGTHTATSDTWSIPDVSGNGLTATSVSVEEADIVEISTLSSVPRDLYIAGNDLTFGNGEGFDNNTNGQIDVNGDLHVGNIFYDSTYWDDLKISGSALAPGAQAPSLRTFKGGIKYLAYQGGTANDISYGEAQFDHKYKLSTVPHVHIHYAIEEAAEAGDTVVIQFEYTWADINELYPAPTTVTTKIPVASKTALTHYIQELTDPTPGSGKGGDNISSQMIFRLERLQNNVSDTYDGANEWFFITSLDIHIEQDSPGSRNEYIK